jgi:hypothetical protein
MYYRGDYVNQDYQQAIHWISKSAALGLPLAQLNLGRAYYFGKGVDIDYNQAATWFKKACDGGSSVGCEAYGMLIN